MQASKPGDQSAGARTLMWAVAYWGLIAAFIVAYLRVHQLAAFTFSVPWVDESSYLWQAIAFAQTGSLYSPQLDPTHTLFYQPPGYMIFIGALVKLFGFSFEFARLVSVGLMSASFIVLAVITSRDRFRTLSLLLCGMFFLCRPFIVSGNISRMEPLLLLTVCLAFLCLQRGSDYKGLAVLTVSPLIHPNGAYFLASGAVLVTGRLRPRRHPPSRSDAVFLAVAVALWCGYAWYAGHHWDDFQRDMTREFGKKLGRNLRSQLLTASNVQFMVVTLLCGAYGVRKRCGAVFLLVLAIPAWLAYGIGQEMWYQMLDYLAYALLSVTVVHVTSHLVESVFPAMPRAVRHTVAGVVALGVVAWNYSGGRIETPRGYPWNMQWGQMRLRRDVSYITPSDVAGVRAFLDSQRSASRTVHVRFYPEADALFFHDQEGHGIHFSQPFFSGSEDADVYIVHTSSALPVWMRQQARRELGETVGSTTGDAHLLQQRDGTEAWYYRVARPAEPE